jgi:regulator of sigma E protease
MAISAERARVGWDAVLTWCGVISSILAIMNLFPFPPFDGFKAVLIGLEAIMRRRVPARLEFVVSLAGFFIVVLLGVVLIFKDTANLVMHGTP